MRIATKFTVALLLGMLVGLGINSYLRVLREHSLFREDTQRDHRTLAQILGVMLGEADEATATEFIRNVDKTRQSVFISLFRPDALSTAKAWHGLAEEQRAAVGGGDVLSTVLFLERTPALVTYYPVKLATGASRVLELFEPFTYPKAYVLESIWRTGKTTLGIAVTYAVLAVVLGYWIVGRRIGRLIDKARRTGAGDLTNPVEVRGRDELAILGGEINAMCDRLASTQEQLRSETAAKIAAIEHLRHVDRLRTVGTLASGIAHEIGTPLNVVQARAQMIESGEVEGDAARHNAAIIVEQSRRMAGIVRQLLDFARPRSHVKERTDVGRLVEKVFELFAPVAERKRVTLSRTAGGEAQVVLVDPGQVEQIIANLVMNSIQAMPGGGTVSVTLNRERRTSPGGVGPEAEYVCLAVLDEGVGIPPERISRIFDPFFTTKGIDEGTGLGLWVSRGIAQEFGGWIEVTSAPGSGSCFRLYVPAASPA